MKWEKKKLGDLIDLYDNIRVPLSGIEREKRQGEYPYYGAQSIIDYVNEYLFDGNYILIAEDGENLRTRNQPIAFAVSGQFWVNNHAHIVKGKSNIADDLFIKYFLNNIDINPYVTGAAQPKLSQRNLKEIAIIVPPLSTQRKIASILSAYDDLIENNLKRIKLLEEKAFVTYKGIVSSEKLEEFTIDEVCETSGGGTPSTTNSQFWDEGEILWFSPTDLTRHHSIVLLDSDKKITELGLQKSSAKLVPPKTILMTSRASIGYFGLINKPASTNQGFINIIPFNKNHSAYMLFDLKNRKEEIIGNANGSTFLEISKGKFRQMKIKLPKFEGVLIEFEKEFETLFNLIENLLKQNTRLREARDILLPRLMNGQIEV